MVEKEISKLMQNAASLKVPLEVSGTLIIGAKPIKLRIF